MTAEQRRRIKQEIDRRRRDALIGRCAGCDCRIDERTPGCKTCQNRIASRVKRAA